MLAPAYYGFMIERHVCDGRFVTLARAMGVEGAKEPRDFLKALSALMQACGVDDLKMSEYGISPENFEELAENAMNSMKRVFLNDRLPLKKEDVIAIYARSYR